MYSYVTMNSVGAGEEGYDEEADAIDLFSVGQLFDEGDETVFESEDSGLFGAGQLITEEQLEGPKRRKALRRSRAMLPLKATVGTGLPAKRAKMLRPFGAIGADAAPEAAPGPAPEGTLKRWIEKAKANKAVTAVGAAGVLGLLWFLFLRTER